MIALCIQSEQMAQHPSGGRTKAKARGKSGLAKSGLREIASTQRSFTKGAADQSWLPASKAASQSSENLKWRRNRPKSCSAWDSE